MPMCKGCEKLFSLLTAERAEHEKVFEDLCREISDLGKRLDASRHALKEIAEADWWDWCRPAYGLQGMAREALKLDEEEWR